MVIPDKIFRALIASFIGLSVLSIHVYRHKEEIFVPEKDVSIQVPAELAPLVEKLVKLHQEQADFPDDDNDLYWSVWGLLQP